MDTGLPAGAFADPAESLRRRNEALEKAVAILDRPRSKIKPETRAKLYLDVAGLEQRQQEIALAALKPAPTRGLSARVGADGSLQMEIWDGTDDELDAELAATQRELEALEAARIAADAGQG